MSAEERRALPAGTVTFLFTDIERSTESAAALGDERWADALQAHRQLLRAAFDRFGGVEVGTEGDSFFVAFVRASDAVAATLAGQSALESHKWPGESRVRVRMGIHTGEALVRGSDYIGHDVHKAKRVSDAGHGGQILLSQSTRDLVASALPEGTTITDLGPHRLKDLGEAQPLYQLTAEDLQNKFPRLRSLETLDHNLPVQLTSFVGRERELDEARELLATTRLLTITGSGGSGKTRIALQLLAEMLPSTPGGVWLADLAPLTDASLVPDEVADAVTPRAYLGEAPAGAPVDRLIERFAGRPSLLLLDNCEHLLTPCAELAATLLSSCPDLKIVVTTREPLGLAGETSWRLPSLNLPADEASDADDLFAYEATRLFCERASQADPSFRVTVDNGPAIADIARRLDGIPLAIELAASRIRLLDPAEISKRLDDRFRLLTGGSRTALPRQQTLRATVDWSYDLLDDRQRALLERLSVFAGGWTLEAAEVICTDEGDDDVLDLLGALVDRSLVVRKHADGGARFRLLDTIRHYAREKLVNSGTGIELRTRHMRYYADLMDTFLADVRSPRERSMMDALNDEYDNMRSAFEWALAEDPPTALHMSGHWWLLGCSGHLDDAAQWSDATLALMPDEPSVDRSAALRSVAFARWGSEGVDAMALFARASKQMSLELGDINGAEWAYFQLTQFPLLVPAPVEWHVTEAKEALDFAREHGIKRLEFDAMHALAVRDPDLSGDERGEILREVADQTARTGDPHMGSAAYRALGDLARRIRDWDKALAHYEEAVDLARESGCIGCTTVSEMTFAWLLRGSGNLAKAADVCLAYLPRLRRSGTWTAVRLGLGMAGTIAGDRGDHTTAARLHGAADRASEAEHLPLPSNAVEATKRHMEPTVRALGDDAFKVEFDHGRSMTKDAALALAIRTLDAVSYEESR